MQEAYMTKVLTASIAAVTLLAGANAPSSANPLGLLPNADQLIEQSLPDNGTTNTQNSAVKRPERSSSSLRILLFTSCSQVARPFATELAWPARASLGRALRQSNVRPSGQTGFRLSRCLAGNRICRALWPAAPATRWAHGPCISAARCTAFTERTTPPQSESACRAAVSVCSTTTW